MGKSMQVDIVSAEGVTFAGSAAMVLAPAVMGEVGVLPGHTPLLTHLKPGEIRLKFLEQEDEMLIYVSGGIMEVQPSGVTILSDSAIRAGDI